MEETFFTGIVLAVHPDSYTCDVRKTESGTDLLRVPVLGSTGGVMSGGMSWNHDFRGGTAVVMVRILGKPYILSTIPLSASPSVADAGGESRPVSSAPSLTNTKTGGEDATSYKGSGSGGYAGGRPTGFLPGDRVFSAEGGTLLGLLSGGLAILKASPLAQIILGSIHDFCRIVARRFEIFTDFGSLIFTDGSSGRVGLAIEGGASTSAETKPGNTKPTVSFYLGDVAQAPDKRIVLQAMSTDGGDYGLFACGIDGAMTMATSKGLLLSSGEGTTIKANGDMCVDTDRNHVTRVAIDKSVSVGGNLSEKVSGSDSSSIGGSRSVSVGGKLSESVSSTVSRSAGGKYSVSAPSINFGAKSISFGGGSGAGASCTMVCSSLNIVKG